MLYVLDTDHLSILEEETQPEFGRLRARLDQCPADDVCTTIITVQERLQGWLAVVSKPRSVSQLLWAYAKLEGVMRNFIELTVLSYTREAQDRCEALKRQRLRLGTMDLRIAAVVLANGATLLSRNLRDFQRVPGLPVEDWSA